MSGNAIFQRNLQFVPTSEYFKLAILLFHILCVSEADYSEIKDHFTKTRSQLPIMFIATPIEKLSSVWTKNLPTGQVRKCNHSLFNQVDMGSVAKRLHTNPPKKICELVA